MAPRNSKSGANPKAEKHDFTWKHVAVITAGIILVWISSSFIIWILFGDLDSANKFGGIFGAVGALFTGLALAGVVVAIFLQRKELELQREELKLTRKELSRSARAQESSEKALSEQAKALEATARLNALSFLPITTCRLVLSGIHSTYLFLDNPSNVFAFDVRIIVVGSFDESLFSLDKFIERFVGHLDRPALNKIRLDEDGYYHAYDEVASLALPSQKTLRAELSFPWRPRYIHCLVQSRDMQGSNYCQLHTFTRLYGEPDEDGFVLSRMHPPVVAIGPRLAIDIIRCKSKLLPLRRQLITEDGTEVPKYIVDGFQQQLNNAIPTIFFSVIQAFEEDRVQILGL